MVVNKTYHDLLLEDDTVLMAVSERKPFDNVVKERTISYKKIE